MAVDRLLNLAPELLERVAQHATKESLRVLRLVSRPCQSKVQRTFAHEHFSRLQIALPFEQSLHRALAISKHPEYGHLFRNLTILTHPILEYHLDKMVAKLSSDFYGKAQKLSQQYWEREDGRDLSLLTAFMSRLAGFGTTIDTLRIATADEKKNNSSELISGIPYYQTLGPDFAATEHAPLMLVLEAVDLSGLRVTRLIGEPLDFQGSVVEEKLESEKEICKNVFGSLRSLKLNFGFFEPGTEPDDEVVFSVAALAGANGLKHLKVGSYFLGDPEVFIVPWALLGNMWRMHDCRNWRLCAFVGWFSLLTIQFNLCNGI